MTGQRNVYDDAAAVYIKGKQVARAIKQSYVDGAQRAYAEGGAEGLANFNGQIAGRAGGEIGLAIFTGGTSKAAAAAGKAGEAKGIFAALGIARKAKRAEKIERHHSDPKFLGGEIKQPLTPLTQSTHKALHKDMNDFLRRQTDEFGNHMRPQRGNPRERIQRKFSREQRLQALADFYKGPGARYTSAAVDFFKQHPELK